MVQLRYIVKGLGPDTEREAESADNLQPSPDHRGTPAMCLTAGLCPGWHCRLQGCSEGCSGRARTQDTTQEGRPPYPLGTVSLYCHPTWSPTLSKCGNEHDTHLLAWSTPGELTEKSQAPKAPQGPHIPGVTVHPRDSPSIRSSKQGW